MNSRIWLLGAIAPIVMGLPAVAAVRVEEPAAAGASPITWRKFVIDRKFRGEGVAVVDVNGDGVKDIIVGDVWYRAPDWKMHVIRTNKPYDTAVYSESFCCFTGDFNKDGWQDVIIVPFPGKPVYWYENPRGRNVPWEKHLICHSCCNESPQYADLHGNGKKVLIMGVQPTGKDNLGQMFWLTPGKDPNLPWEMHPISEPSKPGKGGEIPGTQKFSHGLGVGDMNGDGRPDVMCTAGWWENPAKDEGQTWKWHPANFGPPCSDMHAYDIDGDGKMDVLSSSAHNYGIWWHQQRVGKDGKAAYFKNDLFKELIAQTHALVVADVNGDGVKDFVTGCRWWAHGPKGDAGEKQVPVLYWFEGKKSKDGMISFTPHLIDQESGVGTQFVVTDLDGDGLPDAVVSNKNGVFAFVQVRGK